MSEERHSIKWFAQKMEQKLRQKDERRGRYGWRKGTDPIWLFQRLLQEARELVQAMYEHNSRLVIQEAADVANFAMMIADLAKRKGV
jgi:NTP pyrophosphatase (non-canonical NTP hydrolase)